MQAKNVNIDYCGIRNLLRLLAGQGFTGHRCGHHFLLSFTTLFQ